MLGAPTCHEDLIGRDARRWGESANILLNPSNLAWFDGSLAIDQNLQIVRMRALKMGGRFSVSPILALRHTLSEKKWVRAGWFDLFCSGIAEVPMGWGSRTAADSSTIDLDPFHYDKSLIVNPGSTGLAMISSSAWDYKGLPSFYDLSADALAQEDPRLKFAIRVKRDKSQTVTSEGRSAIAPTPRLNAYTATPAGGSELVAVSASEVYFEREGNAKDNEYGKTLGKPREKGSLFNPYWQVHLIQSDDDVKKAQAMQGAVLP